jgi:pyocin large subunit-like protein
LALIPAVVALAGLLGQQIGGSTSAAETSRSDRSKRSTNTTEVAAESSGTAGATPTTLAASSDRRARIGFRTQRKLDDHYIKHGEEFGDIAKAEYLRRAQALRDAPLSEQIIEARQKRGNFARFDRNAGAFLAYEEDLIILTYFRPDDGEAYFKRAIKR